MTTHHDPPSVRTLLLAYIVLAIIVTALQCCTVPRMAGPAADDITGAPMVHGIYPIH